MRSKEQDIGVPEPRANPELEGHGGAEKLLLDAYLRGQLAHSLLLVGPRGIGKATLAYRFARFVLNHGREQVLDPGLFGTVPAPPTSLYVDPASPIFRRVMAGGHADLLTIEPHVDEKTGKRRSEIVVDDVRAIGPFLSLTPAEGGWRVVVIDSADDLNRNAANAVLKVLEEPPRRSLLLLVSHNPGRLLATIRSRCRRMVLKPLAEAPIAALVRGHHPEISAEDALLLARLAEGSAGRALALAQEGGIELHRDVESLLQSLPKIDVVGLHAFSDRLARSGAEETFATAMELLRWWLSRLIRVRAGQGPGPQAPEAAWIPSLALAASLDRWLQVWEKISRLLARTESVNLDRKQVVLNVFLALEDAVRS